MSKAITDRQESMIVNYIENGGNAYQAALKAKFSKAYATVDSYRVLPQPKIQNSIAHAKKQKHDDFMLKLGVTLEWRMNKLKRIVNEIVPDKGETKHKYVHNAIKAMSEITRLFGDYAPDKRVSITVNSSIERLESIKRQYKEY